MSPKDKHPGGLVYSTDFGRMCPGCMKPLADCICKHNTPLPEGDGVVRILYETKGRKGKGVTVISGLLLGQGDLKALARELKAKCGSGGTIKDNTLEIQGDHRDKLAADLKAKGFNIR